MECIRFRIALVVIFSCSASAIVKRMKALESKIPISRWRLLLINVIALVISVPVTYFSILMATFTSDSGPNIIAVSLLVAACSPVPLVIVTIIMSQIKRSVNWAGVGLLAPLVPIGFSIVLVIFLILFSIVIQ